jgi:hypothetical protein
MESSSGADVLADEETAARYFNRVDRLKVEPRAGFETCCYIVELILIFVGFSYNNLY